MTTTPTSAELADSFSVVLNQWLTTETIAEINRRNATCGNPAICASHDFCDANQAMIDAMERHGMEWEQDHSELVNAAWSIAKAKGFKA